MADDDDARRGAVNLLAVASVVCVFVGSLAVSTAVYFIAGPAWSLLVAGLAFVYAGFVMSTKAAG